MIAYYPWCVDDWARAMVFYYCPSFEAVKEILDMAIHQVCPCTSDDVFDSAWKQWIQLMFKSHPNNTETSIESPSPTRPFSRMTAEQLSVSRTSSCSSCTADTVVRVLPIWYFTSIIRHSLLFDYWKSLKLCRIVLVPKNWFSIL